MSCCGNKRAELRRPPPAAIARRPDGAAPAVRYQAVFEYQGRAALTVVGQATGTRYHFGRPGARLPVALTDRRSLALIPALREIG